MIMDKWVVEPSELDGHFQLEKRVVMETALQSKDGAMVVFGTTESAQQTADQLNSGEVIPVLPQNRI